MGVEALDEGNGPMSIEITAQLLVPMTCVIEVSEKELDAMVAEGVDVTDEFEVAEFYQAHIGEEVNGVHFADYADIQLEMVSCDRPDIEDWWPEGEAPDRFWPQEHQ